MDEWVEAYAFFHYQNNKWEVTVTPYLFLPSDVPVYRIRLKVPEELIRTAGETQVEIGERV